MGTWGTGPFDDDTAADWANELDDAAPDDRLGILASALRAVLDEDGYLDTDVGVPALAAACVVPASVPGGPPLDRGYGPEASTTAGLVIPPDLVLVAAQALRRVLGEESEWRELWEEAGRFDEVRNRLEPVLRAVT